MPFSMIAEHADASRRREGWLAAAILTALVLWRVSVFLVWPQAHFDADQGVFGLMAKHLSEGRAFPIFMYGQSYILAVEAWMAAPLFFLFGASATLLKLPLVFVNIAVVLLLLRILVRETGLRPLAAAVPILFFALPAPGTSAYFLQPSGGNLEPFLYMLLLWITRHRPHLCGAILALGFLQREFTIYGVITILVIEAANGTLLTRAGIVRRLQMLRTAAEVWIIVQFIKRFASAAGPGTSVADLASAPNNLQELVNRTCVDPATLSSGAARLLTEHWPQVFGVMPSPIGDFSIESTAWQGVPGTWLLFVAVAAIGIVGVAAGLLKKGTWHPQYTFCVYLLLVGALSAAGYVAGRCGQVGRTTMRYELLSILGAVGLGALCLCTAPQRMKTTWIVLALACTAVAASGHARLSFEYAFNRPVGAKELLVRHLQAHGIQYGYAEYWTAYYVSFITNEQVILASTDLVRVKSYHSIVAANREKAVRISREYCDGGRRLTPSFFLCSP